MKNDSVSKSWFCVFNNPEKYNYTGTPQEIVDKIIETWITDNPQRACAVSYCISADGLKHLHAVFEDTKAMRFSKVKKLFPSMHITPTKGNKEQAEDYISKRGQWEETGEKIIYINRHGEIKGVQGQRKDLELIEEMLLLGKRPNEIMELSLSYRRYEKIIRDAYYHNRMKETPMKRDITVYWHVGKTGTGKSYKMLELAEEHGEDDIYIINEYVNGFDKYNGEKVLFMDEYKGQLSYAVLLSIIQGYKIQVKCRYTNIYSLWGIVHITSIFPIEKIYKNMVSANKDLDTIDQLKRRINYIIYHYKKDGEYCQFQMPISEYTNYEDLINKAERGIKNE